MNSPFVHYVLRQMSVKTNFCSRQRHEHGYTLPHRTVTDYNLIYVTRGRVVWVIDGKSWPMQVGGLVIVPPNIEHHAFCQTQRITLDSVHVEVSLPGGQDVLGLLNPPHFQKVPKGSRLDLYLRGIDGEFDRDSESETRLMLPGWAELIVRELIRHDAETGLLQPRMADPLVATILNELDKRMTQPVTLSELAVFSGFSAQHLNRVFRHALGVTPLQYLARTRMERAAALLRKGRLTVHGVAKEVGIEDAYYFSRQFRAHHGQSPSRYRDAAGSDSPSQDSIRPFTPGASRVNVRS